VCPDFIAVNKKAIMEHALFAQLWHCDFYGAKLEISIRQISVQAALIMI
jgi:hypothetical protein